MARPSELGGQLAGCTRSSSSPWSWLAAGALVKARVVAPPT